MDETQQKDELTGRQELFNHMSDEHGLILLQSEMMEIERIVLKQSIPTDEEIENEYLLDGSEESAIGYNQNEREKGAKWLKQKILES